MDIKCDQSSFMGSNFVPKDSDRKDVVDAGLVPPKIFWVSKKPCWLFAGKVAQNMVALQDLLNMK